MNIGIIGSGWLAQPLARALQADGHPVCLTTRAADKLAQLQGEGLSAIQFDLQDDITDHPELAQADALVLATTCKTASLYRQLIACNQQHPNQQVIMISSTSVYQNNGQKHDETSTHLNADNPLLAIEAMVQSCDKYHILRLAGLVGPGRHPGRFFKPPKTIKNPNNGVNLIHLDDCIGLLKALLKKRDINAIVNGCADNHPPKGEYYPMMAKKLNRPVPDVATKTAMPDKIIDNQLSKEWLSYQYLHPDVWHLPLVS